MLLSDLLEAKILRLPIVTQWRERKEIACYVNPSAEQITNLHLRRGLFTDAEVLVWSEGLHIDIATALDIPGGDSRDENRRYKIFVNWKNGEPLVAVHVSRIDDPWVKRLIGHITVETFSR